MLRDQKIQTLYGYNYTEGYQTQRRQLQLYPPANQEGHEQFLCERDRFDLDIDLHMIHNYLYINIKYYAHV